VQIRDDAVLRRTRREALEQQGRARDSNGARVCEAALSRYREWSQRRPTDAQPPSGTDKDVAAAIAEERPRRRSPNVRALLGTLLQRMVARDIVLRRAAPRARAARSLRRAAASACASRRAAAGGSPAAPDASARAYSTPEEIALARDQLQLDRRRISLQERQLDAQLANLRSKRARTDAKRDDDGAAPATQP
jgi:hypothetical protein